MEQYFKRQIQLWGKEIQQTLQNKQIAIIGCGGLGCSVALALGTIGLKQIDLIDFDIIEFHNIHRQIGFTLEDINQPKAEILAKLLRTKTTFTKFEAFVCDFEQFVCKNHKKYDLIIDATDNLQTRIKLDRYALDYKIPWVYGSVESFHGQVCLFENSSFESIFAVTDHQDKAIAAPMVMQIASLQSNLAIRYLACQSIQTDLLYYLFFDKQGNYNLQQFKLPKINT
jgi:adenylyltransferase/sulfurtransferase